VAFTTRVRSVTIARPVPPDRLGGARHAEVLTGSAGPRAARESGFCRRPPGGRDGCRWARAGDAADRNRPVSRRRARRAREPGTGDGVRLARTGTYDGG